MTYDSFSETRSYDPVMLQLNHITTRQGAATVMDMTDSYTAGQNNGRITSSTDGVLGETVNYTYDSYNRLASAQATNNAWGNAYIYDGFSNWIGETVTAGSAPYFSTTANPATNGLATASYDADGNTNVYGIGYPYDVENRLTQELINGGGTYFGYDPSGKRVTQIDLVSSQVQNERIYFYSTTGQRLATYTLSSNGTYFTQTSLNLYFGSKLLRSAGVTVATDRLGSVRANSNGEHMNYWPWGQERTSTADGREKVRTYFRDQVIGLGLDYADQRYYGFNWGRFQTPDP
jgi:hypothetical protein